MTRSRSDGRGRLRVLAGALLVVVGASGLVSGAGARAQIGGGSTFRLTARADVASIEVIDPAAPLVTAGQVAYVTPGTAQAEVDSIGASTAFASTPYPGDFVVGLPGILNGFSGAGLPEYPLAVFTSYPTVTEAGQEQGPYGITAASGPTSSHGRAAVGVATGDPQVASSTADADAAWTDGTGTATATSEVVGLAIGTVLRIGELRADATMAVDGAGTATKTSSLSFGSMTVGGVEVGLTESGLQVADSVLPGPDLAAVSAALAGAGITLTYLPASESPTSITSAGLAITQAIDVPSQGRVELRMVLGQVTVTARAATLPVAPAIGAAPAPVAAAAPATAASQPAAVAPPVAGAASAPAPATAPPVATAAAAPAILASAAILPSARVLYLVLALAGLAAMGGSRVIGLFAVRSAGPPPHRLTAP